MKASRNNSHITANIVKSSSGISKLNYNKIKKLFLPTKSHNNATRPFLGSPTNPIRYGWHLIIKNSVAEGPFLRTEINSHRIHTM